jgi:predicted TIM-barrel enzyme
MENGKKAQEIIYPMCNQYETGGVDMAYKYTREQVLERLHEQIKSQIPILMFGAGTGLSAKCAEKGKADLIGVYSTAIYRMMGMPSITAWLPYSNANELLLNMSNEILPAVKSTPCIAGIGAHDPSLNMDSFIDKVISMGFSGINNEPFVGLYGKYFADQLERSGLGFSCEVELIRKARNKNIFTVAWVMSPEEAYRMAEAGADVIGAMIGVTFGGMSGEPKVISLEEAIKNIQAMIDAAKTVNHDIIVLTHGGPLNDVETAQYSITHSDAVGYASGSSGERIPAEQAIVKITRQYKSMKLN